MNTDLIYVYCLANSPPEPALFKDFQGLTSLGYNDFFVVVKYVSPADFSEENFKKHLAVLEWLESNAREHFGVIRRFMEYGDVIPFKFGTIFQTENSLNKFIADYSGSLAENFSYIAGKEEWSLKVYCDRKALSHQIDELSPDAAALEQQIMESSPGKAYLLKRKKTELIENEMDRICKNYGQAYFDEFNTLSTANKLSNLLPKEITGREDIMILNATFLLSKSTVALFNEKLAMLRKKDANSGFLLEITGPWPPFNFICIQEK